MSEEREHEYARVFPVTDTDSDWWWQGISDHRLLVPRCETCGRLFFPPQPACPHCGAERWAPEEWRGQATVYSWIIVHRSLHPAFRDDVPYVIVAANLEDEVRVLGRLTATDADVQAGAPLRPHFYEFEGRTLLGFEIQSEV